MLRVGLIGKKIFRRHHLNQTRPTKNELNNLGIGFCDEWYCSIGIIPISYYL